MAEELELKNAENDELLPVDSVLALTLPSVGGAGEASLFARALSGGAAVALGGVTALVPAAGDVILLLVSAVDCPPVESGVTDLSCRLTPLLVLEEEIVSMLAQELEGEAGTLMAATGPLCAQALGPVAFSVFITGPATWF